VEGVLVSVDQWSQGLHKGLDAEIEETQRDILVMRMSVDHGMQNIHKELSCRIQGTQVDIQAM
jgi:hypothetical protein